MTETHPFSQNEAPSCLSPLKTGPRWAKVCQKTRTATVHDVKSVVGNWIARKKRVGKAIANSPCGIEDEG